tara:strand:+ start:617 stop:1033 length:417 start_codon:yes stop_codon:yes gene_type:complete
MPKKRRDKDSRFKGDTEPDLTPLINCMFLLLIFFMVATTFVNPKGLSVDLPGGQGEDSRATKDLNIVIEDDGTLSVNGESTVQAELANRIQEIMAAENTKNVILEAARNTSHGDVVKVVDIARGQGIEAVAFAKASDG